MITVPPWAWQRSAQSDIVTSSVPPSSASSGPSVHQGATCCLSPSRVRWPSRCCRFSWLAEGVLRPAGGTPGLACELLGVGEQVAPLREEEVDHVQALAAGLRLGALGGEEVDVGIPAE